MPLNGAGCSKISFFVLLPALVQTFAKLNMPAAALTLLQIALKESNESEYWLELMAKTQTLSQEDAESLLNTCRRIRFTLIRSINTARQKVIVK